MADDEKRDDDINPEDVIRPRITSPNPIPEQPRGPYRTSWDPFLRPGVPTATEQQAEARWLWRWFRQDVSGETIN
jgi:hypothetical protein